MDIDQFENYYAPASELITHTEVLLLGVEDRTLMRGIKDGHTLHFYLKDRSLCLHLYKGAYTYLITSSPTRRSVVSKELVTIKAIRDIASVNAGEVAPNLVWPHASDYHFCKLLEHKGQRITFTDYYEGDRPKGGFYGELIPED